MMNQISKLRKFIIHKYKKYKNSVHFIRKLCNEIDLLCHYKESIVVDGWLVRFYTNSKISNWGDDLNVYFINLITSKKIFPAQALFFAKHRKKYCVIGTIIPQCVGKNTIIWGSGYGLANGKVHVPQKILAVRGPKTRQYLQENGIDCPPIFGDPALLLPKFYKPKVLPRKSIGLIPHHRDYDLDIISKIELLNDWIIIDLVHYANWTDIIDQINSCDMILSSSLHGLIVADAYSIPNVFMEFLFHQPNYNKYEDYFLSVNKEPYRPYQFSNMPSLALLEKKAKNDLLSIRIDTTGLMKSCPFIE